MRSTRRAWLIFNEADKGGGGGSDPALDLTAENQPEPVGASLEEKLTSSKSIIGQLFSIAKKTLGLEKDLKSAKDEGARLQQQFDAATAEAATLKGDLATAKSELASMTTARETEKKSRETAEGNVSRLEMLCGVKGIDPNQTVAPAQEDGAESDEAIYKKWKSLSGQEKSKFRKENSEALDRYAESQRKK